AERTAVLEESAVPGLVGCLTGPDERVCANGEAGLLHLAARWGPQDGRTAQLSGRLAGAFPRLSGPGQRVVLRTQVTWLGQCAADDTPPASAVLAAARAVALAARGNDPVVRCEALEVTAVLLSRPSGEEILGGCRELLQTCLQDSEASNRCRAIGLA